MKRQTQFKNASLVSVINGSIVIKDSNGGEHTFVNASVVSVNNGTIVIEKEWKPKEGELVKISTTDNGIRYAIFKEILDFQFWMYCSSMDKLTWLPFDYNKSKWYDMSFISNISPVTPEEQKEFDDFCKSQGKLWNRETLQWEKYEWEPERGEKYYYIDTLGDVSCTTYNTFTLDSTRIKFGNCFQTKEQAKSAAEKVKELLKSL